MLRRPTRSTCLVNDDNRASANNGCRYAVALPSSSSPSLAKQHLERQQQQQQLSIHSSTCLLFLPFPCGSDKAPYFFTQPLVDPSYDQLLLLLLLRKAANQQPAPPPSTTTMLHPIEKMMMMLMLLMMMHHATGGTEVYLPLSQRGDTDSKPTTMPIIIIIIRRRCIIMNGPRPKRPHVTCGDTGDGGKK
mmetsp:Transcript_17086/g.22979  ORF Transcript_17086/g.22979 Transcript_17086/m.22979 type:complete len:190 (-) Transcript_17086:395-964(-)